MKKALIAIARPICRLISAALWQLVWLVPLWGIYWYGKHALPSMIQAHFGVDQAQDRLASLEHLAEVMKNNASLTNPAAILHYLSAQLSKLSTTLKLNSIEMTSNIIQTICLWGLNILWILALIYALIRTIRLYRSKSEIHDTANAVAKQIHPQIVLLKHEIASLREEIQNLKNENILNNQQSKKLPPHE